MQTTSYSNKSITVKKAHLYAMSFFLFSQANRAFKVNQCLNAQVHKYGATKAIYTSTSATGQDTLAACLRRVGVLQVISELRELFL